VFTVTFLVVAVVVVYVATGLVNKDECNYKGERATAVRPFVKLLRTLARFHQAGCCTLVVGGREGY